MQKIKTKEDLIDYVTRVSPAYRKTYKFYRIIRVLEIAGGIVSYTIVLAIAPVFISIIYVIPTVILLIKNATKLGYKKKVLKSLYKKFISLLSFVQCNNLLNEKELIKEVFSKINNIYNSKDYTEPLEMYIKKYKLNEYNMESLEKFLKI